MTATDTPTGTLDQRVLEASIGALELFGIYLGPGWACTTCSA